METLFLQDPTNPLSVAPPRYKYHPNPETITNFPNYRSESDVESLEGDTEHDDENDQDFSDEGSDFSDEEDKMPDVKTAQTATYDEGSVKIIWRTGHDESTLEGVTRTLIAVNQVGLVLSQALEKPRNPSAQTQGIEKVGYVTLQRPASTKGESNQQRSPRKVFTLWIIASGSTTTSPRTLLAVQVGRVSDRAVHIVSDALVKTTPSKGDISDTVVVILDTYIPQTYVPSAQPESRLYLDTPPVRYLKVKKTTSLAPSEGIEKFESPNYMTGISAGLLASSAQVFSDSILLLMPKPIDGRTIIHAISAAPGCQFAADKLKAALKAADMDWADVNYSSTGGRRSGRRGNSSAHGIIGDGGMYV